MERHGSVLFGLEAYLLLGCLLPILLSLATGSLHMTPLLSTLSPNPTPSCHSVLLYTQFSLAIQSLVFCLEITSFKKHSYIFQAQANCFFCVPSSPCLLIKQQLSHSPIVNRSLLCTCYNMSFQRVESALYSLFFPLLTKHELGYGQFQ